MHLCGQHVVNRKTPHSVWPLRISAGVCNNKLLFVQAAKESIESKRGDHMVRVLPLDHNTDLCHDLLGHKIVAHFQPEIDLQSGPVVGAEILLRRKSASGVMETAAGFITDLERLQLLPRLTHMVLDGTTVTLR